MEVIVNKWHYSTGLFCFPSSHKLQIIAHILVNLFMFKSNFGKIIVVSEEKFLFYFQNIFIVLIFYNFEYIKSIEIL